MNRFDSLSEKFLKNIKKEPKEVLIDSILRKSFLFLVIISLFVPFATVIRGCGGNPQVVSGIDFSVSADNMFVSIPYFIPYFISIWLGFRLSAIKTKSMKQAFRHSILGFVSTIISIIVWHIGAFLDDVQEIMRFHIGYGLLLCGLAGFLLLYTAQTISALLQLVQRLIHKDKKFSKSSQIDETKLAEPTPSEPKPSITKPPGKSSGTKIGVLVALAVVVVAGVMLLLWQEGRKPALEKFTNSIGMEFVLIPDGSFTMGSNTGHEIEKPPHNVKIPQSFYLQTTEVTQGQWKKVMGDNPSFFKQCGEDCPVESVSWDDAQRFIEKLNQLEKTDAYRLPSEAEWEYACRAGTTTEFSFGDDAARLGGYAWYSENSNTPISWRSSKLGPILGGYGRYSENPNYRTQRVADKKPNSWGLYDMHGNVWEWVEDDRHSSYKRSPSDGRAWVDNPRSFHRMARGGSWSSDAWFCRAAMRLPYAPGEGDNQVGFRLSRSVSLGQGFQVELDREPAPQVLPSPPPVRPAPPVSAQPTEPSSSKKITNSLDMEFVLIPAGSFTMGSRLSPKQVVERFGGEEKRHEPEQPPHEVKISKSFYLQTTEVTQGQWKKVMEWETPSYFSQCGDNCPVESVSWDDAQRFIEKLNQLEKTDAYRLPSEAEWEYACRAGTTTEFSFGDDAARLGGYAWDSENHNYRTRRVAGKKPNPWGVYDMHGNVWEWVEDDWHDRYVGAPADGRAWVDNPRGSLRVMRGGGWGGGARGCRSAVRSDGRPDHRDSDVGFRLSRSVSLGP
jgi:formylglycine-generating enzyme required for sulfatase activity